VALNTLHEVMSNNLGRGKAKHPVPVNLTGDLAINVCQFRLAAALMVFGVYDDEIERSLWDLAILFENCGDWARAERAYALCLPRAQKLHGAHSERVEAIRLKLQVMSVKLVTR
jgi:hypothetical protein